MRYFAATSPDISEREIKNTQKVRRITPNGMVLLKNDGTLPLMKIPSEVALYGSGARHTVKGGTGSGDVNVRSYSSVEDGLKGMGIRLTGTAWLDRFDAMCDAHRAEETRIVMGLLAEKGQSAFTEILARSYRDPDEPLIKEDLPAGCDRRLAIYVLGRNSGEGRDRRAEAGDYDLTEREKENISFLCESFQKVVILLNVGGPIDTKFLRAQKNISAILLISQGGIASGDAVADVLTGKAFPSGHLTATWAESYQDYPTANTFSHRNGNLDDEYYEDGIYVGYRFFDSFNVTPAYPFGYGLSYTSFELSPAAVSFNDETVTVTVRVRNTGAQAGREVVQIYASAPEGRLEKPYQELVGFKKTKVLTPGEEESLEICFPAADMASYDEQSAAWIMERGSYVIRVGASSRDTHVAVVLVLDETTVTEQLTNHLVPETPLKQLSRAGCPCLSYEGEAQEIENAPRLAFTVRPSQHESAEQTEETADKAAASGELTLDDVRSGKVSMDTFISSLHTDELAALCVGCARQGPGAASIIGIASMACPGAAGETTSDLSEKRHIPAIVLADGPAGLRLFRHFVTDAEGTLIPGLGMMDFGGLEDVLDIETPKRPENAVDYYQYCTAIPIATMLAQTWDETLIAEAGDIIGEEMEEFGVHIWLAPGMNIQRNPLCGRNFEYYSEDPLLSGKCAAAEVRGVQAHRGRGACIKHFAMNNQEDNREHVSAWCGERAIREIYLRGFQIAVRESDPMTMMTSYNLLNGIHTANNRELLTDICRGEWHYRGMIMTDWSTTGGGNINPVTDKKYGYSDAALCVAAGNDLIMPGSTEDVSSIIRAAEEGKLASEALWACARRVVETVLRTEG